MATRRRANTLTLTGASGRQFRFDLHLASKTLPEIAGVYVITRRHSDGRHRVIYVSETTDIGGRFAEGHERIACLSAERANRIGVLPIDGGVRARQLVTRDLVRAYDPPCLHADLDPPDE